MNKHHTLALLLCLMALFATSCEPASIANQEVVQTVTPTPVPTNTPLVTSTPTLPPTFTPTLGPSPTPGPTSTPVPPTATPIPSPTPLPPTAVPDAALKDFSVCTALAGNPDSGRFSMEIKAITATVEAAFERVVFTLNVPGDSVAPSLRARCAPATTGYEILLDLDGWQHDDLFRTSVATATTPLSGTKLLSQVLYRFQSDQVAGASLVVPLAEPHAFHVTLEANPARIILEVAKAPAISPASDMLATPNQAKPIPGSPIFYLQDGDIWSYADGKATNLTNSPEVETALATTQGAGRLAFCRATSAPGDATEVSSLWVMEQDGNNPQELAAPGRSCSQPTFAADGKQIAFVVDEDASGALPARLSVWLIDLTSGAGPERVGSGSDEWSRFGPQWLANGALVYSAHAEDGRSTMFLRNTQNQEIDIGAPLLVADSGQGQSVARYQGFGTLLTSPDGKLIAVEGLRLDAAGADVLLLDERGNEQKGTASAGYWSRPVAFGADNTLYYLTTSCASDALQNYTLVARPRAGAERTIALGLSAGGFGQFMAAADGIAYVTFAAPTQATVRGPLMIPASGASALWFWDLTGGGRASLVESTEPIPGLAR